MKKVILGFAAFLFALVNINAQDATDSKWQARFRVLSVVPTVDDNFAGGDVGISTSYIPELDFTYFFTKNIAAELILGTSKNNVEVKDAVDLGHVWLLPPTLNLQYHLMPTASARPYIGAGVNYTIFYGADEGDSGFNDIEYANSVGFSFQGGVDIDITEKLFFNLDVKKVLLGTDVDLVGADATTSVEVDINPWLIGVGVGMKF
jgi:outer membrane protein